MKIDSDYEHVQDMFINNIIFRPLELEILSCYDMITHYELKKIPQKKIESGNINIDTNKTFNLRKEHPSHKYMVMSERSKFVICAISSINLHLNISDLDLISDTCGIDTNEARELYSMIAFFLFYPFRDREDLLINDSYWQKYKLVSSESFLSQKILEVLQNIQDCSNYCSMLKSAG